MKIIPQEAMLFGSNSVFNHWEPYEIPVHDLTMNEVEDVVLRYDKAEKVVGPMRSRLAQLAADAVQSIVELDSGATVGAPETPGRRYGRYSPRNEPLPEIAVLADITIGQYWQAISSAVASGTKR